MENSKVVADPNASLDTVDGSLENQIFAADIDAAQSPETPQMASEPSTATASEAHGGEFQFIDFASDIDASVAPVQEAIPDVSPENLLSGNLSANPAPDEAEALSLSSEPSDVFGEGSPESSNIPGLQESHDDLDTPEALAPADTSSAHGESSVEGSLDFGDALALGEGSLEQGATNAVAALSQSAFAQNASAESKSAGSTSTKTDQASAQNSSPENYSLEKQLKPLAEKSTVGQPAFEANPAFAFFASVHSGTFTEHQRMMIAAVLSDTSLGVRPADIEVQLAKGVLYLPRLSEYACVYLASRLREYVDEIEMRFQEHAELTGYADGQENNTPSTDSKAVDLMLSPKSAADIFTSNLGEIPQFAIEEILTQVVATKTVEGAIDDDALEKTIEELVEVLTEKAFRLGAHGVIGIKTQLNPLSTADMPAGLGATDPNKSKQRLMVSGTAVRLENLKHSRGPQTL